MDKQSEINRVFITSVFFFNFCGALPGDSPNFIKLSKKKIDVPCT
jgi:hypothetical protein